MGSNTLYSNMENKTNSIYRTKKGSPLSFKIREKDRRNHDVIYRLIKMIIFVILPFVQHLLQVSSFQILISSLFCSCAVVHSISGSFFYWSIISAFHVQQCTNPSIPNRAIRFPHLLVSLLLAHASNETLRISQVMMMGDKKITWASCK